MKDLAWLRSEPWLNQEVIIIGGGPSLKTFNWECLKEANTIGCNDAYKLGHEICKICVFGDFSWWQHHLKPLEKFNGIVVTNACGLADKKPIWVNYFNRVPEGLHYKELGWNGHTGSVAINLALILGAKIIYLLGFDMSRNDKNETNWHKDNLHPNATLPQSYQMFLNRWQHVIRDLNEKFSNRKIINVNDTPRLPDIESFTVKDFIRLKGL